MSLKECYAAFGGDYEDVISRMPSEKFVEKFVLKFLDDKSYEMLETALEEQNYEEAFRAAHTIKGICQNLSFVQLMSSVSQLVEELRNGQPPRDEALVRQVKKDYRQTIDAISCFCQKS